MGVLNYKDIYCEMKDLIRNILREHTRDIGEGGKPKWTIDLLKQVKDSHN